MTHAQLWPRAVGKPSDPAPGCLGRYQAAGNDERAMVCSTCLSVAIPFRDGWQWTRVFPRAPRKRRK